MTIGNKTGKPKGYSVINKFGFNDDIDTGDTPIEIWSHGAIGANFVFLDTGIPMDLVSTSANDTLAGTGAQKVKITYYLTDNTELIEIKDMNGLTRVPVNDDLKFAARIEIIQTGSGNKNAGEINLVDRATGLIVYQSVEIGEGQTLSAIQICPKGKKGLVKKHSCSYSKAQSPLSAADMRLRLRAVDGSFLTKHTALVNVNKPEDVMVYGDWDDLESGIKMVEGEIIFWECVAVSANDTPIDGRFDIQFWDIS
jgi:hypothetical protein